MSAVVPIGRAGKVLATRGRAHLDILLVCLEEVLSSVALEELLGSASGRCGYREEKK